MTDAPGASLALTPPEAVTTVEPAQAEREVAIAPDAVARIDQLVVSYVESVATLDVHGDEYRRRVDDINGIADREIRLSSDMSNRLLDRPVRAAGSLRG